MGENYREQWFPGRRIKGVTEAVHDPGDGSTKSSGFGMCGDQIVQPGDWILNGCLVLKKSVFDLSDLPPEDR